MNYLIWAVIALVAYSLVPPLSKLASDQIPIMTVALIANIMITVVNLAIVVYIDDRVVSSVTSMHGLYALGAGAFLTIGVLSYFHSLSIGPVSVVTPIFGLFLVGSAIIGMSLLGEAVTPRKLLGLGFAAIAVYLTTT